ncbi:MAG: c-type cytochrome [Archangium sp.]|nr:c-type cytochrome [Archangium sp.]
MTLPLKLACLAALLTAAGCQSYCATHLEECLAVRAANAASTGGVGGAGGARSCNGLSEDAAPIESSQPPPAITGGSLTAMPDGTWVAADADRSMVWHVGAEGVLGRYPLRAGDGPGRVLAMGPRAFIVLRSAGQLAELDLERHVLSRWDTCTEPRGLAVRGEELLVGCATGRIEAIAPTAPDRRTVVLDSPGLADLRDLTFDGSKLLVSTFRNAQVFEVQAGASPRVLNAPAPPPDASQRRFVPRVAWRMRDGLLVAQNELNSGLPPFFTCNQYYGPPAGFDTGVITTTLYRVAGDVRPIATVPSAVVPVDVAERDGVFAIASAGTNALVRVDVANKTQVTWPLPGQPTGVAFSGKTLGVFLREPASLLTFALDGELLSNVSMNAGSVFSTGHDVFHRATLKGIACASCHPEAGEDGHVWQFAEGARRTPSLRGGLAGTAPFHWTGDLADMSQLMMNVMNARMGGASQSAARTDALLAWLDAQPALRAPPVNADAVARGQALFESSETGCASCHAGPLGTNNATVDVGTGGFFQVPRLSELAWRSPLLHDGSLSALDARVFPTAGPEQHGKLSHLDAAGRADLLEYLRTR